MTPLNRRQFVAACACATCPALRALAEAKVQAVDAGPFDQFREKGIHDPQGAGRTFFLVNRGGRLYAVSATCTHKKVALVVKDGAFRCPRHGSAFSIEGDVTKAPARKALSRYAIRLDDQRHVVVDRSRAFAQGQWNDPASYVRVG